MHKKTPKSGQTLLNLWRFRWRFQENFWRILALFDWNRGALAEKNLATLSSSVSQNVAAVKDIIQFAKNF